MENNRQGLQSALREEGSGTLVKEPRYWGWWRGLVVKAIVIDGARTWDDIRSCTGLSGESLDKALDELFVDEVLEEKDDIFRVSKDLCSEYRSWWMSEDQRGREESDIVKDVEMTPVRSSEEKKEDLVSWIEKWRKFRGLHFSMENKHFYLEGRHLDDISEGLVSSAKREILAVNPFVENCHLSNSLSEASKRNIDVRLITRSPESEKAPWLRERKQEYYEILRRDGVMVAYNNIVHAKLIVVDGTVAVISSMNFNSRSSGGATWEAGIVSTEQTVVESVANSVRRLLKNLESVELV